MYTYKYIYIIDLKILLLKFILKIIFLNAFLKEYRKESIE